MITQRKLRDALEGLKVPQIRLLGGNLSRTIPLNRLTRSSASSKGLLATACVIIEAEA